MAYSEDQLQRFMDALSGEPASQLKMLLYRADLDLGFATDEQWASVCEFAVRKDEEQAGSAAFAERYERVFKSGGHEALASALIADMKDNFIFAAMLGHRGCIDKDTPLIPAAAFNKHAYQGLLGEFALVRFLEWSGFDVSAADGNGMTALHYFASVKYPPGTIPRAVNWLIDHGADVHAENRNGDTALTYLCAVEGWSEYHTQSFTALAVGGSDLFHKSADGGTPLSLLKQLNEVQFHSERQKIIEDMETIAAARSIKTPRSPHAEPAAQMDASAPSAPSAVALDARSDAWATPTHGNEPESPDAPLTPTLLPIPHDEPLDITTQAPEPAPLRDEPAAAKKEITFFQDLVKKYITRR